MFSNLHFKHVLINFLFQGHSDVQDNNATVRKFIMSGNKKRERAREKADMIVLRMYCLINRDWLHALSLSLGSREAAGAVGAGVCRYWHLSPSYL